MSRFVESRVRTKRLRCSMCNTKINKGNDEKEHNPKDYYFNPTYVCILKRHCTVIEE